MTEDIRFSSYQQALRQLKRFIDKGKLSELEEQGLIKSFEYTYELACNTLKDLFSKLQEKLQQLSADA